MKTLAFENGDAMPALGLGTWKSKPDEVYRAVKQAIAMGYRHIDCAAAYRNEGEVGRAIAESVDEGVVTREELWITSKLWNDAHAPADVEPALQQTLSDLGLDYLDLYLVHWPVAVRKGLFFPRKPDDLVSLDELPIADTWSALEACRDKGLCRHLGVSNFSIDKLRDLKASATSAPEVNQVELHPYLQQPDMVAFCRESGIVVTAYSPLGSRDRPSMLKEKDEPVLLEDPAVARIAERVGATPAQVLLRWAVARGTSVIPKSVNQERMAENLASLEIELSDDDMQALAGLDRHRRYVTGEFWALEGGPYTIANLWDE